MTDKEIVQALRCTSTPGSLHEDCTGCPYYRKEKLDAELKEKLGVDTWPSCDVNKVGMDAADLIERLTAENAALREKQRWIPVTERLPERDVQVLGWYKDNPFSQYRHEVVAWNGNGWVFVYAHRYVTNVTHWMPLPEAPEEGEKEDA